MKHSLGLPLVRWERDLERFLVEHPELLGLLIFGWQVKAGLMRRVDLLGIDGSGDIYVIEVKRKIPTDRVIAQVLDYLHWGRTLTREHVISVAARRRMHSDFLEAFAELFGHPLPTVLNRTTRVIIIAAGLDLRTARAIEVLNDGPYPVAAFRYRVVGRSIVLEEMQDVAGATQRSDVAPKPTALGRSIVLEKPDGAGEAPGETGHARQPTTSDLPLEEGYPVNDDVREFWALFSVLFEWPFVPFAFVYARYKAWRKEEKKEGRHRSWQQGGLFGKQIAALVRESKEWEYERRPLGDLMAEVGACPYLPSLSEGYTRRYVSGYRRLLPAHAEGLGMYPQSAVS